jgi:triacylglycerol esterase/lipase EstA (alpha/beta hydrolase family)
MKFLKTKDPISGKMLAYPNGIPGFKDLNKIHFIGHSMGALTVRYL